MRWTVLAGAAACLACQEPTPAPLGWSITPDHVAVSAFVGAAAPSATLEVRFTRRPQPPARFRLTTSSHGLQRVDPIFVDPVTIRLRVTFTDPDHIAPGTYEDTIGLELCADSVCAATVPGSRLETSLSYAVKRVPVPPVVVTLSPDSALVGSSPDGGLAMVVTGLRYEGTSTVLWDGEVRPTTFLAAGSLRAQLLPADLADAGTHLVSVRNAPANGGDSNAFPFGVRAFTPAARLDSLWPIAAVADGPDLVLSLFGEGFGPQVKVEWNHIELAPWDGNSTSVMVMVPAAALAQPGQATLVVRNPASAGGLASNPLTFLIEPQPSPTLEALVPSQGRVGSLPFPLRLTGSGFGITTRVLWKGAPLPVTYLSPTELEATVVAAAVARAGAAQVQVENRAGVSAALDFTVERGPLDAVTVQVDPAHTGAVSVNALELPPVLAWSRDLGGAPGYPLIAEGKVFVTVDHGGHSELLALDLTTGATVWGPRSLAGVANAAYEGGLVFVVSGAPGEVAVVQAFEAASGTVLWVAPLDVFPRFLAGLVALGGAVYTGQAGEGWPLYILDAATGAVGFGFSIQGGPSTLPAVTPSGFAASSECNAYRFGATWDYWSLGDCGGPRPVGWSVISGTRVYAVNGVPGEPGSFRCDVMLALPPPAAPSLDPSLPASVPPSIGPVMSYFAEHGVLRALPFHSCCSFDWSVDLDAGVSTAPLGVNQYVFIGVGQEVLALDGATGARVWAHDLGAPIPPPTDGGDWSPLTAMAVGHGLLVVPAGHTLTAFTLSRDP